MKKYFSKFVIRNSSFVILATFFAPLVASAAATDSCTGGLAGVICRLSVVLSAILPFLVSLGVLYFIWGVVQYFIGGGEEAKTEGRDRIIYGIIGLAVIIAVWGLVYLITNTLGVGQDNNAPDVKTLVTQGNSSGCDLGTGDVKFQGVLIYLTCIISRSVVPFIFAIAVAMFIWGAVKFFIIDADNDESRAKGKEFMLWGIIALAVMISIWGLVSILSNTFGIKSSVLPQVSPNSGSGDPCQTEDASC